MPDAQTYRTMITAEGWKVQEQDTPQFVNVAASRNTTSGPEVAAVVIALPGVTGRRLVALELLYAKVRA